MSELRLQFVSGAGLSSRLISWWGQGYDGWSHVDAVLITGELAGARSDAVGGKPPGYWIRPANYQVWKRRTVMTLKVSDGIAEAWERFLRRDQGAPYDQADIIGFLIGKSMATQGHWVCSWKIIDTIQTFDLMPSICLPASQVTPNTLAAICSATGWLITVDERA